LTKKRRYPKAPPVYASISGGNSSCHLCSEKRCSATILKVALPLCAERMTLCGFYVHMGADVMQNTQEDRHLR
jgi:hypothetical protein